MTTRVEAIWRKIDAQRLRRLLLDLLQTYSPSGKEEDVQLLIEETFRDRGLAVERQPVADERYNLRLTLGAGEPQFYLVGHVDTVTAFDLEDFGPREEGDLIHGLGSADMKGGCAAMCEAFLALAELPRAEQPPIGLLLVVGEEENGDGSAAFLRHQRPRWVVIGEPTSLNPCFSHYGYLEAGFVTRGRRIHSSLPELGHNAVESMLRVLLHLGRDPLFNRENSGIVYSIREMSSGRAGFVVPDRCESWIDLHLPPDMEPEKVMAAIRRRVAHAEDLISGLDLDVDFAFAAQGYRLAAHTSPAQVLTDIYRRLSLPLRQEPFRSHSDGNLFFEAGVNPLILGPGSLEVAHTPDEQTSFAEVLAAAKIYAALALECG
ncbi:MAG: M20/M25/M40 family metallo-hydrolase [Desulfuromonadales bacterium]